MANTESLPFEIGIEKAKRSMVHAVHQVSKEYDIPASLMVMILENIVIESKLNTFSTIVANYDISNPAPPETPTSSEE